MLVILLLLLWVWPFCLNINCLYLWNILSLQLINILRVSLISRSALTNGLSSIFEKDPKQVVCICQTEVYYTIILQLSIFFLYLFASLLIVVIFWTWCSYRTLLLFEPCWTTHILWRKSNGTAYLCYGF